MLAPKDLSCVILAGGQGSRLSEETSARPKPLVEIGGRPILWHIMKIYTHYGVTDFIICLGYMGYKIKEYFDNYRLHQSNLTIDMRTGASHYHSVDVEPWRLTLIDTGQDTMTGGRIKRIQPHLPKDRPFFLTYGDGVGDVDLDGLLSGHLSRGRKATVTAVRPLARFGALELDGDKVTAFKEKPRGEMGFINGGFFVLDPSVIDYIEGDQTVWELDPLERLAREDHLRAHFHEGFWQPMDTLRDKHHLEDLWREQKAPWKTW